jgi:hypothetical protein
MIVIDMFRETSRIYRGQQPEHGYDGPPRRASESCEVSPLHGYYVTDCSTELPGCHHLARVVLCPPFRTDPPARPVPVTTDHHDELSVSGWLRGKRSANADADAPGLSRSSPNRVVSRRRPVLENRQDGPGQL